MVITGEKSIVEGRHRMGWKNLKLSLTEAKGKEEDSSVSCHYC